MPTSRDTAHRARGRAHHRLRLLRAARHRGLRRLRRQLPARARARRRRGHRRRRGPRHAHARARRARPDAALQHPGRLNAPGAARVRGSAVLRPAGADEAPPARHQRLPAQGGRHPELPLGPVAAARPGVLRRAHRLLGRPGRRVRRRAGRARRPHRAGARARSSSSPRPARSPPCASAPTAARGRPGPARPRAPARPPRPAARRALRRHPARRRGHGARPAPRARAVLWRACSAGAALVVSAGGYPAAEARRAAPGHRRARGRDPARGGRRRHRPAARRPSAARRGPGSACPARGPLVVSVSRLVPRKGMDVLIEAAGRLAPSYPRPRGGHRRPGPRAATACGASRRAAPCGSSCSAG